MTDIERLRGLLADGKIRTEHADDAHKFIGYYGRKEEEPIPLDDPLVSEAIGNLDGMMDKMLACFLREYDND